MKYNNTNTWTKSVSVCHEYLKVSAVLQVSGSCLPIMMAHIYPGIVESEGFMNSWVLLIRPDKAHCYKSHLQKGPCLRYLHKSSVCIRILQEGNTGNQGGFVL